MKCFTLGARIVPENKHMFNFVNGTTSTKHFKLHTLKFLDVWVTCGSARAQAAEAYSSYFGVLLFICCAVYKTLYWNTGIKHFITNCMEMHLTSHNCSVLLLLLLNKVNSPHVCPC